MDCQEIIKTTVALEIMQGKSEKHMQQRLFNCIYNLFQNSFLNWIMNKYGHQASNQKLKEDAKDAFQNGLTAFFIKSQSKDFTIKGSIKTTIYSFGLLQLLAFFKKDKLVYGIHDYVKWYQLFFEDDSASKEKSIHLNELEYNLLEALKNLPKKRQEILIMKFFQKLKSKQIAELLHVSPGNVDNETVKAFKELRIRLKSYVKLSNLESWN